MKIDKYEKIGVDKYRLYLDNGEVIDTYDNVILENDLLLKKDLSLSLYHKILVDSNISEYYHASCKYISIRVRSKKEMEDYLKRKNVSDEDIELVISKLTNNKLLDDEYFCKCFIKDKLKFTNWGEYRIKLELKKHNIDDDIINNCVDLFNYDVIYEKIEKIVEKQIKNNRKLDKYKLRNKIYYHLLNLGYSSGIVVEVLNKYF